MRRITQTILHNPATPEIMGNCWQAAIASLLDLDLDEVPHFVQQHDTMIDVEEATRSWAQARGFEMVEVSAEWLAGSDMPALLYGRSPRNVAHVVVGRGPLVVHDPHPSRSGLRAVDGGFVFFPCPTEHTCHLCHVLLSPGDEHTDSSGEDVCLDCCDGCPE
jgi:hypothetical protein